MNNFDVLLRGYAAIFEGYIDDNWHELGQAQKKFGPSLTDELAMKYLRASGDEFLTEQGIDAILSDKKFSYWKPDIVEMFRDELLELEGMSLTEIESESESRINENKAYVDELIDRKMELTQSATNIIRQRCKDDDLVIETDEKPESIVSNAQEDGDSVILYVYSETDGPESSIGLEVTPKTGKIELFEENDEAGERSWAIANALTADPEKEVKVFAAHTERMCEEIHDRGAIPEGLFFSPDKNVAKGYLQEDRDLISFKIKNKYIRKHSHIDWRAGANAPISDFKFA